MQYLRYILLFLSLSQAFINYPTKFNYNNQLSIYKNNHIPLILQSHNKSKIYKITFDDDIEDEKDKLFKPKYKFGLTDFDLFLFRMYIYFVLLFTIIDIKLN
jgi:hypothetical protein